MNFGETRRTILESFESIIDTINDTSKRNFKGQVNIFDINSENEDSNILKHQMQKKEEYEEREILQMEKEMLGIYISGHPLDKFREIIKKVTTINTIELNQMKEESDFTKDGKTIKYAGIITSVKKKYTKRNTQMAFIKVEDLYGSSEIIVFDSCFEKTRDIIISDNIVLIEGKISTKEDEEPKIIANNIIELKNYFKENNNENNENFKNKEKEQSKKNENNQKTKEDLNQNKKILRLDITNTEEKTKVKLRGIIKFFVGNENNIKVEVIDDKEIKSCGMIYLTNEILEEFKEILGKDKIELI